MKKVIIIISGLIVWYFGYYECESFCVLEGQGQDYQAIISSTTTGEATNLPVSPFIDFSDNPELVINDFVIRYFYGDVIPGLSSKSYAEYTFENYAVENISPENLPKDLSDMEFQQVDNAKYFRVKFDATSKETGEQFKEVIIYYQVFLDEHNMIRVNRYWANGAKVHSSYIYYGPDLPDLPAPWTGMNNIPRRAMEDGFVVGNWVKIDDLHDFYRKYLYDRSDEKETFQAVNDIVEELSLYRLPWEVYMDSLWWCVIGVGARPAWVDERKGLIELQRKVSDWLDGKIQWEEVKDFIYSEELEERAPRVAKFARHYYGIIAGEKFDLTDLHDRNLIMFYLVFCVWGRLKKELPDIASGVYTVKLELFGPLTEEQRKELEENDFWILEENGNEVIVQNTSFNFYKAFHPEIGMYEPPDSVEIPLSFVKDTVLISDYKLPSDDI